MKLSEYVKLEGTINLKSGLHIGTGEKGEKGEAVPVLKSLQNGLPYIPGSSLKGKMRCLLELVYGRVEKDPNDSGSPCWCGQCQICLLFGSGSSNKTFEPSRLIFRDSFLEEKSKTLLEKIDLEEKPGVRIDRDKGKAAGRALFPMERVPEGCEFKINISVRVFDGDDKDAVKKWLSMGLFLVEQDAIGGGGTRGSGHIEFTDVTFEGTPLDEGWREECKKIKEKLLTHPIKKADENL